MVNLSREVIEIEDDETDYGHLLNDTFALDDAGEGFLPLLPEDHFRDQSLPLHWNSATDFADLPLEATDPNVLYQIYLDQILGVFPDICLDHIKKLFNAHIRAGNDQSAITANDFSQAIITQILDTGRYPKEKDKRRDLKRKRPTKEESDDEGIKWTSPDRPAENYHYFDEIRCILQQEFINIPQRYIDLQLKEKKFLYPAYLALELAERTYNETPNPPFHKLKSIRKPKGPPKPRLTPVNLNIESELSAVKGKLRKQEARRRKIQEAIDADLAIDKECEERGDMVECQCCFTDTPIPKSTYCNGENVHFFCFNCARSYAQSQTELSRYKLSCMDGSGCKAEFTRTQIYRFLDEKMIDLLERLQQQDELRSANLANLETCPFCDYAAICEPIEADKEFHCCKPDCERVSCRLCKQDSHLPKTCEEHRKENGLTERHVLEEAMTKALIRECPKCHVPILKDGGCNKLTCSKCNSYVCDYCGKDITKIGYAHFQPERYGRGASGCPATDNTEQRNAKRIEEVEKATLAKIRAENPTISEDDLKIKFSEKVQAQGQQAMPDNPYHFGHHMQPLPWHPMHYNDLPQYHQHVGDNLERPLQGNRQGPEVARPPHHRRHLQLRQELALQHQQRMQEIERRAQDHQQRTAERLRELQQRNTQTYQHHVEEIERRRVQLDQPPYTPPTPTRQGLHNLFDREMANFRHRYLPQDGNTPPLMNPNPWQPYVAATVPHPPFPYVVPIPNPPYAGGLGLHYDPVLQYGGAPEAR